jgi:hypothetical protein
MDKINLTRMLPIIILNSTVSCHIGLT